MFGRILICKPISGGGLGIHILHVVQSSLHMKIAWNLLQGTYLWSNCFHGKYVDDKHIFVVDPKKGSNFWKMVLKS